MHEAIYHAGKVAVKYEYGVEVGKPTGWKLDPAKGKANTQQMATDYGVFCAKLEGWMPLEEYERDA